MIKSIYRFFVLGFFVLGFSIKTNAEESEALYSAVSNIESYQSTISDILPSLWQQVEDIIVRIDSQSHDGSAFNIYSDQLEWALDGTRPFYTQDQQLYDVFYSYYEDFLHHMEGIATVLSSMDTLPELNTSIDNNISSIMSQLDSFSTQFTFDNGDLNVYDQRLAGLIQELKEQSDNNHQADNEQIRQLGESLANHFKELAETIRDSSSSSPADNFLTQAQLEETYEQHKIFKFFEGAFEIGNIPFSPFYKYKNSDLDKDLETSFEVEEYTSSFEVNDIFSLLASAIEYQSKIASADNKSLILISKILKGEEHNDDKEELQNELNEIEGRKQELLNQLEDIAQPIENEISVQNNKLKNYDFSLSNLSDISSVNLPATISFGDLPLSNVFGIDLTGFKRTLQSLDISYFHPMIEACRTSSEIILYILLGLFFLWVLNILAPKFKEFVNLLKSITTW